MQVFGLGQTPLAWCLGAIPKQGSWESPGESSPAERRAACLDGEIATRGRS